MDPGFKKSTLMLPLKIVRLSGNYVLIHLQIYQWDTDIYTKEIYIGPNSIIHPTVYLEYTYMGNNRSE
jgi:hypothetical protein